MAAAAALLTMSVWLGSSAERVMQRYEVNPDAAVSHQSLEVEALSAIIGDAENPRALAEWMIERRDADLLTAISHGVRNAQGAPPSFPHVPPTAGSRAVGDGTKRRTR